MPLCPAVPHACPRWGWDAAGPQGRPAPVSLWHRPRSYRLLVAEWAEHRGVASVGRGFSKCTLTLLLSIHVFYSELWISLYTY